MSTYVRSCMHAYLLGDGEGRRGGGGGGGGGRGGG